MFGLLRRSWPVAAAAAGVLALTAAPADAAPTELKYKFVKGTKIKYRMSIGTEIDAEAQGDAGGPMGGMAAGGMKFNNNYEFTMTWTVLEVKEDGTAKVKSVITRVKGSAGSPMAGEFTFDTDEEGEAPTDPDGGEGGGEGGGGMPGMPGMGGGMAMMGKYFKAMKGGAFEFTVKPTGEITKLTGMNKVMEKATKALEEGMGGAGGGGGMPGMGGASMITRLLGKFGNEMWKPWIESALVRLPAKPVDLGDAWNNKVITPMPVGNAKIAVDYTYALAGTEEGIASFIVDGNAKLKKGEAGDIDEDDKMAKAMAEAMEFKEISESSNEGSVKFDVEKGLVKESKITGKTVSIMTLDMGKIMEAFMGGGNGGMGGGMEMPKSEMKITNTQKVGIKLLKVTPADGGEGF
jgi:hypothetical protein